MQEEEQEKTCFWLGVFLARFTLSYIGVVTEVHTKEFRLVMSDLFHRIASNFTRSKTCCTCYIHMLKTSQDLSYPSNKETLGYFLFFHR